MSGKLYFITAKTKGENPVVLFLNGNIAWSKYAMANPLLEHLHRCQAWAEAEPTHCLFVEAKDFLRKELKDIMNSEKDFVTPAELKQLIEKHSCHTVSTEKEKPAKTEQRQPTQDTPIEQPQKRVGYVLFAKGANGEKTYINSSNLCVMIGSKVADVFMTEEQANFVCYTRNRYYIGSPWQVEQIEF